MPSCATARKGAMVAEFDFKAGLKLEQRGRKAILIWMGNIAYHYTLEILIT